MSADFRKSTVREYFESIVIAVILALFIRTFVVQAFKIPSGSMLPTLQIGDHILVNKFVYGPRLEVPLKRTLLMLILTTTQSPLADRRALYGICALAIVSVVVLLLLCACASSSTPPAQIPPPMAETAPVLPPPAPKSPAPPGKLEVK